MNVILDTNIYVNDFKMKSGPFDILFKYAKAIPFQIFMPEIVYDEVLTKYRERLIEEWAIIEKKNQTLSRLLTFSLGKIGFDIDKAVVGYKEYLDTIIKNEKIRLLKYPKIEHKLVVQSILNREKPFKDNGEGYRDKLILETLKESFKCPNETIIFISNNIRDFGNEPVFYDEIQKQLTNKSYWQLKNSLQSFIDEYIKPFSSYDNHVDEKNYKLISEYVLSNKFKDLLNWKDIGYDITELEKDYGSISISKIDTIKSIEISNKVEFNNSTLCKVKITGNFILYVSGSTSDFYNSQSWREYFDYKNEEGDCSISGWQRYYVELYLLIKIEDGEIFDAELKHLKTTCGEYDYNW